MNQIISFLIKFLFPSFTFRVVFREERDFLCTNNKNYFFEVSLLYFQFFTWFTFLFKLETIGYMIMISVTTILSISFFKLSAGTTSPRDIDIYGCKTFNNSITLKLNC